MESCLNKNSYPPIPVAVVGRTYVLVHKEGVANSKLKTYFLYHEVNSLCITSYISKTLEKALIHYSPLL